MAGQAHRRPRREGRVMVAPTKLPIVKRPSPHAHIGVAEHLARVQAETPAAPAGGWLRPRSDAEIRAINAGVIREKEQAELQRWGDPNFATQMLRKRWGGL
jgi:hypothetical protein